MTTYFGNYQFAYGNVNFFLNMPGLLYMSGGDTTQDFGFQNESGQLLAWATGAGFTYDAGNSALLGGTIETLTEYHYVSPGDPNGLFAGYVGNVLVPINVSAASFWSMTTAERFQLVFAGDDIINGGGNADLLGGGAGADQFDGQGGTDTVSYQFSTSGVGVNLTNSVHNFGDALGDTFLSIEKFIGSNFADTFTGGSGNDDFDGGAESDEFFGSAGNDIYRGGAGDFDKVNYSASAEAVNVALTDVGPTIVSFTLGGGADTLYDIECVAGSQLADVLTGNALANILSGQDGNDLLNGGGGGDTLLGGRDNDIYAITSGQETVVEFQGEGVDEIDFYVQNYSQIYALPSQVENFVNMSGALLVANGNGLGNSMTGGAANDILSGLGGNDTLIGGGGTNTLIGGAGGDTLDGSQGVFDWASYATAGERVVLRFSNGYIPQIDTSGDALGDTFISIEGLVLSGFDDVLIGGPTGLAGLKQVNGGAGNDVFITGAAVAGGTDYFGGADNDTLLFGNVGGGQNSFNGEGGNDTASFMYVSGAGLVINMAATLNGAGMFAVTCNGQEQHLVNVENIDGSQFGDTITGNAAANILKGLGGADTIDGGAGADQLLGGDGDDTILYDALDDLTHVLGGADTDTLRVINQALPVSFDLAAHQFERANALTSDSAGNWWTTVSDYYDAAWQRTNSDLFADDGRLVQTTFDVSPGGTGQNWQYITDYRSASNILTNQDGKFDDGTLFSKSYDYAAGTGTDGISDELAEFTYFFRNDAERGAGLVANVEGYYDDGRKFTQTNDVDVNQLWTFQTTWYKSDGVTLDFLETHWDDGHTTITPY